MLLAEDDDLIKTFPSDRADQPFGMSILPWRLWRCRSVTYPHRAKSLFEYRTIDAVAIANEIFRRAFPAAGFGELPGNPFGGRMRRHSQPQHLASVVSEDQQPLQKPKRELRNDKQVY